MINIIEYLKESFKDQLPLKRLPIESVVFGCDPEFFLEKNKKIIGSEKVIPENGIGEENSNRVIIDGVQAELNPLPNSCRQSLKGNITNCFRKLHDEMIKQKVKTNFSTLIEVSEDELKSLKKESLRLGCSPSKTTDPNHQDAIKLIDPEKYTKRSAGGHIHIGKTNSGKINSALRKPQRLITIFDIIVGNTCVLLDRDPGNEERRKMYGRAGEYRTPSHGIEYRTLSNFWLRSYPLMSFVMSISRLSTNILAQSTEKQNYEKRLLKLVNMDDIRKAINENNFKLALKNFNKIRPFLIETASKTNAPFTKSNLEWFDFFIKKGINHWFKDEPIKHWLGLNGHDQNARMYGWESYLKRVVKPELEKTNPIKFAFKKSCKHLKKIGNKRIIIRLMLIN